MATTVEPRKMWAVLTNTDLTEGRGQQYTFALCEYEATARRMARKQGVQGCDARYCEVDIILYNHSWYGPIGRVYSPTDEDRAIEKTIVEERERKARKDDALEKARALGLGEEDLKALLA